MNQHQDQQGLYAVLTIRRASIWSSVIVLSALAWVLLVDMASMTAMSRGSSANLGPGMSIVDGLLQAWSGHPANDMDNMSMGDDGMMMNGYANGAWSAGYFLMMVVMW